MTRQEAASVAGLGACQTSWREKNNWLTCIALVSCRVASAPAPGAAAPPAPTAGRGSAGVPMPGSGRAAEYGASGSTAGTLAGASGVTLAMSRRWVSGGARLISGMRSIAILLSPCVMGKKKPTG